MRIIWLYSKKIIDIKFLLMKISIMICFVTIKDKQFRKLPLFFSTFSIFHLPKTLFFCWPQDFCLAIKPICSVFETKKFSIAKKQKFLTPKCNKLLQVECKKGGESQYLILFSSNLRPHQFLIKVFFDISEGFECRKY